MFCPKCGRKIWEQEKFCVGCGERLNTDNQSDDNTNQFNNGSETKSNSYTYRKPYSDPESFQNYQLEKRRLEVEVRKIKLEERKSENFKIIAIGVLCLIALLIIIIVLYNVYAESSRQSAKDALYQDVLSQHLKSVFLERVGK